jgi:hypothetical protein
LSDAIQVPDLRPRALEFVRRSIWAKIGGHQRFAISDLGLFAYGVVAKGYALFSSSSPCSGSGSSCRR